MVRIKRVYDPPAPDDGRRVLVDRLWPRGLTKEKSRIDEWLKNEAKHGTITLLFGAKDPEHNNAAVLREIIKDLTPSP